MGGYLFKMARYLIKKTATGFNYVTIPFNVNVEEAADGHRFKGPNKVTKWYKGYILVRADSPYKAFRKVSR